MTMVDEAAPEQVPLLASLNEALRKQGELQAEVERLLRVERDLRHMKSMFENRVRDAAIEVQVQHHHHISVSALNEWLEDLGLAPVEQEYLVTLKIPGWQTVTVKVTASTADGAQKYVASDDGSTPLIEEAMSGDSWEPDLNGIEITEVEEA